MLRHLPAAESMGPDHQAHSQLMQSLKRIEAVLMRVRSIPKGNYTVGPELAAGRAPASRDTARASGHVRLSQNASPGRRKGPAVAGRSLSTFVFRLPEKAARQLPLLTGCADARLAGGFRGERNNIRSRLVWGPVQLPRWAQGEQGAHAGPALELPWAPPRND